MAVIVHGGAYAIPDHLVEPNLEGCKKAAQAAHKALTEGRSAMDAVEIAVRHLEDDPTFNAGHGAALNARGQIQMDAIIMEGKTRNFGSVAAVQNISNPVSLARMVMEKTDHVLLVGEGANDFAKEMGVPEVDLEELVSQDQKKILEEFSKYKSVVGAQMNAVDDPKSGNGQGGDSQEVSTGARAAEPDVSPQERGHDTVGAVALDCNGDIAVATSTGGIAMKRPGRVGDSCLVGSGAYCENGLGGASTTGHGESIARALLAHRALSAVESCGEEDPHVAVGRALEYMLKHTGGRGGVIMIDGKGRIVKGFSTLRMAWASVDQSGSVRAGIDEPRNRM